MRRVFPMGAVAGAFALFAFSATTTEALTIQKYQGSSPVTMHYSVGQSMLNGSTCGGACTCTEWKCVTHGYPTAGHPAVNSVSVKDAKCFANPT